MSPSRSARAPHPSLYVGLLLSILAVTPLQGQAPSADSMAFPRQVLSWYLAGDAQQVWPHVGPMMREMAGSPSGLQTAAAEITGAMGPEVAILGEQLIPHPNGRGMQVYVRTVRHSEAPEMFWIVTFWPEHRQVQMIMPQARQTIRILFPEVRLP